MASSPLSLCFDARPPVCVPIVGRNDVFPVGRIFCVGRNYAAHSREMGGNPDREPPFFFTKPSDCCVAGAECVIPYPPRTADLHHEVELVIGLGHGGADIAPDAALGHVFGAAVGVDFTRRDLQAEAKALSRPWDMAKGFDGAAIVGPMHAFSGLDLPQTGAISLSVNGDIRQQGDLSDMIWPVADIVADLSRYLTLQPGDLIYTGTPAGVGAVKPGDVITASCAGLSGLTVRVG
jgi:fumarylpyruvate hydrolase